MSVQLRPRAAVRAERVATVEFGTDLRKAADDDARRLRREVRGVAGRPQKRLTVMPGTRCSASATDLSGNAPMSVAVIESTTVSAFRLICCDVRSARALTGDDDRVLFDHRRFGALGSVDCTERLRAVSGLRPSSWANTRGLKQAAPRTRVETPQRSTRERSIRPVETEHNILPSLPGQIPDDAPCDAPRSRVGGE